MLTFNLEEKRLQREIRRRGARRVLIQLPEGLKSQGVHLAAVAEEAGATAIISADPCYGACDLALGGAKDLDVDLIVHYGHSKMLRQRQVPTVYIEAKARISVKEAVEKATPYLKHWKKIGLITTVQHVHKLNEARDALLKAQKIVAIGDAGRMKYAGQVTGCDYTNANAISRDVEAFLFVGGGRFHALGATLATGKPTVVADPYEGRAYTIEDEARRVLRQRWASIHEAEKAEAFGVLIGLKAGQRNLAEAMKIKRMLEDYDRKVILLALREITPEALVQFPNIEAFVNTACPRVSLDDASRFPKPVLIPIEMQVMLKRMSWEELCRKGWFGSLT